MTLQPLVVELARIRVDRGIPRRMLAAKLGYAYATLFAWETGKRQPPTCALENWVSALGYRLTLEPKDGAKPPPAIGPTCSLVICKRCHNPRRHKAKGLCASCYLILWRKAAAS